MPLPALLSLLVSAAPLLQGQARIDCAPWDGPAFTLMLPAGNTSGTPGLPLRIAIWEAAAIHAPRDFRFPRDARLGAAVLEPSQGPAQLLKGSVRIERAVPGLPVQGQFDLSTPQGKRYHGSFQAPWRTSVGTRCG